MKHGTISAYTNESCRCDDCRKAMNAYQRRYYRTSEKRKATNKRHARVSWKARAELARRYEDEYRVLYEEFMAEEKA